jgi:flagellar biosynthesis protein FliQ
MNQQLVVQIFRDAMMMNFWLSVPILSVAFISGIVISLVQIVTSIQDSAFASVPRLAAFLAGLLLFLPWMLMKLVSYTIVLFGDFSKYAR